MNKYQTPDNEIITGVHPDSAIRALRENKGHTDKYYDAVYDWKLQDDGIHLIETRKQNR